MKWIFFRVYLVFLVGAAACGASPKALTTPRTVVPPATQRVRVAAPADVVRLVGWDEGHAVMLASGAWTVLDAFVLERIGAEDKEVVLAVVRDGELVGTVPLAHVKSTARRPRSVAATVGEVTLGVGNQALRVDLTTYEGGGSQLFAVKATVITLVGDRLVAVFDRLVESGDRVRDRRAVLTVKDGDIVVEERETGTPKPRVLTYRQGRDGRFVTRDRSIFEIFEIFETSKSSKSDRPP